MNKRMPHFFNVVLLGCLLGLSQTVCSVSADAFFQENGINQVRISPDGGHQLLMNNNDSGFTLSLRNSNRKSLVPIFDSKQLLLNANSGVLGIEWIDNRYIALVLIEDRASIADLVETKSQRYTYFIDIQNPPKTKDEMILIKTSGWFAHTLPQKADSFLYAKSGVNSRVYSIRVSGLQSVGEKLSKTDRVDGGQFSLENIVAQIEGYAYRWFTAVDGQIVAVLVHNSDDELALMETTDFGKTWTKLKVVVEGKKNSNSGQGDDRTREKNKKQGRNEKQDDGQESEIEYMVPIAYAGKPGKYYTVLEKEQMPDALYLYDFSNNRKELLYQHATADIFRVITSNVDYRLLGVGISNRGEPQFIYFDDAYENVLNKVRQKGKTGYLAISESDLKNQNYIIYEFASDNPGTLFIYNESKNELAKLGDVVPELASGLHSELIVDELKINGLSIEYFLSKPSRQKTDAYPLVVIPHGGPIGILDHRLYDPLTQYLVANGFAVLQVNYRGSAGYGKEFIEAGKKQWGSGMLEDIHNVLATVKKRSDIESDRICIAGSSYGGYAALALPIKYPGDFKCAASLSGVTDVQLMISRPDLEKEIVDWYSDYVGDPVKDADYLKQISPVYNADKLEIPVLLAHGEDDDVVDIEHLYRMSFALDQLKRPYQKIILDGMGHEFEKNTDAAVFYSRLLAFLESHLK